MASTALGKSLLNDNASRAELANDDRRYMREVRINWMIGMDVPVLLWRQSREWQVALN